MSSSGSGEYGKVRARYNGAIGNHRVVGLATKTRYGRHKRGDIFWVHRDDVDANPEMFTVVGDALSVAATLPKTPDDLREPWLADVSPEIERSIEVEVLGKITDGEADRTTEMRQQMEEVLSGVPQGLIDEALPFNLDEGGTPIAALGLNGRVVGVLLGAGIETVEALKELQDIPSIMEIPGIGEKTLNEILAALESFDAAS